MTGKGGGWLLREREKDGYDGKGKGEMAVKREGGRRWKRVVE